MSELEQLRQYEDYLSDRIWVAWRKRRSARSRVAALALQLSDCRKAIAELTLVKMCRENNL